VERGRVEPGIFGIEIIAHEFKLGEIIGIPVQGNLKQLRGLPPGDLKGLLGLNRIAYPQSIGQKIMALQTAVIDKTQVDQMLRHMLTQPVANGRAEPDGPFAYGFLQQLNLLFEIDALLVRRGRLDPTHGQTDLGRLVVHAMGRDFMTPAMRLLHDISKKFGTMTGSKEGRFDGIFIEDVQDTRHGHPRAEFSA